MKAMGTHSIASLVKVLLDVGWYLVATALVLSVVVLVVYAFSDSPGGQLSVPVSFELDSQAYSVASSSLGIEKAEIQNASGNLKFPVRRSRFVFANLAILVVLLGFALWVLTQLRHIFRTLRDGQPFVAANARRIRWVGIALIAGELARAGIFFFANYNISTQFSAVGIHFRVPVDISGTAILNGLIILVIAEVFRAGTRLNEDQSLTI